MVTKAEDQEEAFTFALLLNLTASSARLRSRCADSIEKIARGLSKAQIARCKREAARRANSTKLPKTRCPKHGVVHIFAVNSTMASEIVLHGASAALEDYNLVRGLGACVVLKTVGHRLTEQAWQMYFDALQARVSSDVSRGPIGARHSAEYEAANALPTRRRQAALAELQREIDRDYDEAFVALDEAVDLELAMRTATALRTAAGSGNRASLSLH